MMIRCLIFALKLICSSYRWYWPGCVLLEKIQRRSARFVKGDHRTTSSVTQMLHDLGWRDLSDRRRDLRLALLYKVVTGHVAVGPGHCKRYRAGVNATWLHPQTALWDIPVGNPVALSNTQHTGKEILTRPTSEYFANDPDCVVLLRLIPIHPQIFVTVHIR